MVEGNEPTEHKLVAIYPEDYLYRFFEDGGNYHALFYPKELKTGRLIEMEINKI